mgnify:CR=1 FL=1
MWLPISETRPTALFDTIVVINGDHGETLYDHECWFDHHGMYDTVLVVGAPVFRYYPVDTTPDNDAQSPAAFTATSGLTAAQLEDVARKRSSPSGAGATRPPRPSPA